MLLWLKIQWQQSYVITWKLIIFQWLHSPLYPTFTTAICQLFFFFSNEWRIIFFIHLSHDTLWCYLNKLASSVITYSTIGVRNLSLTSIFFLLASEITEKLQSPLFYRFSHVRNGLKLTLTLTLKMRSKNAKEMSLQKNLPFINNDMLLNPFTWSDHHLALLCQFKCI